MTATKQPNQLQRDLTESARHVHLRAVFPAQIPRRTISALVAYETRGMPQHVVGVLSRCMSRRHRALTQALLCSSTCRPGLTSNGMRLAASEVVTILPYLQRSCSQGPHKGKTSGHFMAKRMRRRMKYRTNAVRCCGHGHGMSGACRGIFLHLADRPWAPCASGAAAANGWTSHLRYPSQRVSPPVLDF